MSTPKEPRELAEEPRAEIERLKEAVEFQANYAQKWRENRDSWKRSYQLLEKERDQLRADLERLAEAIELWDSDLIERRLAEYRANYPKGDE